MTLTRRPDGVYVEPPGPAECPNGHPLRYPNVGVGWRGCPCAGGKGHRTWFCYTCSAVTYRPEHREPVEVFTGRWK